MNEQHHIGAKTELYAAYKLAEMGYTILFPQTTQSRYDIAIEKDGVFKRVQVKKATTSLAGSFNYTQCRLTTKSSQTHYKQGDFDLYFITDFKTDWIIPFEEVEGFTSLCFGSDNPEYKSYKKYDPNRWVA